MSATPQLEAQSLARYYTVRRGLLAPTARLKALDGVSFTLHAGQTLAVVGESGCGKSTLARQLTLIEPPTSGHLHIAGHDVTTATRAQRRHMRRQVQIVFQDPSGCLNPRQKVGAILAEPLRINTSDNRAARAEKARAMMARVGLRPEHYRRYPHMFSGGQRQRIAIARALMLQPAVVVADEPVSALDVSIQAQVLNLLMDLQQAFDTAYVLISHDLFVVRHIADEVMVLYLGRPVEQGPAAAIFAAPRHPYTRALLASTPHVEARQRRPLSRLTGELPSPLDPPSGCAFHTRCPHATDECRQVRPALHPLGKRLVACHHAASLDPFT
ncbi:putative D,D-dipeptide transport ATP-binding protein DdpF [Candidatus Entotheonellaceae bacterium PAL068K]